MIIRAKTFRKWFEANLKDSAQDIANHGADAGYPCITYTSDCVKIFDKFSDEIWDWAVEDSENLGYNNVLEFIATFRRNDMASSFDSFKNLLVWYAAEKVARELTEKDEDDA